MDETKVKKEMSARKVMAIMFSVTYCLVILTCTMLLWKKIITVETYVALVGAFALMVREIVNDYFERKDRTLTEEKKI
jgi:hypothetical protein